LVLGAGEMGRQTAILAGRRRAGKIVVAGRTEEKAAGLAELVGGMTWAWEEREAAMAEADVIITATGSEARLSITTRCSA